ncbi:hypothetical protein [Plebeiibacterium sediminum]|uniref:Lipoprotein n=1 Tax=Plebeiibacterium sediminum TaxID=2992112 RepID=A0AAE3SDJ3_9BACT|nr:hypothetical protein [Plebeiobacterium sediminum]MCW3785056.1 hypothetical protein [Plebeiobacterium sediminum]
MKYLKLTCIIIFIFFFLSSCIPGGGSYNPAEPAGFFSGIWHGWIAPFSLILSIFNKSISIYEINNTGWWYDFGFYISIISGFGGIQLARKKRNS